MVTLSELAAREAELSTRVGRVVGTMEAKETALAEAGVFGEYTNVVAAYTAAFAHAEDGAEALARATFLMWYELAEPACFSGIRDLPATLVRTILARLDAVAADGGVSRELAAMLGYYHSIADYAFTRDGPWPALASLLASSDPYAWHTDVDPPPDRWSRGQLSEYWSSIRRDT